MSVATVVLPFVPVTASAVIFSSGRPWKFRAISASAFRGSTARSHARGPSKPAGRGAGERTAAAPARSACSR